MQAQDWRRLIQTVFEPRADEKTLAILIDLPDAVRPDNDAWRERRQLAASWHSALTAALDDFTIELWHYPNAHTNNGDLPASVWPYDAAVEHVDQLAEDGAVPFVQLFERKPLLIAMSELSATAPLKVASRRHGFRAATMPRFSPRMMPALALDLGEVDRRCRLLKDLLDRSVLADFVFLASGTEYRLRLDLRHRSANASSGLLHEAGTAGNLPSGETYIVPYEGEIEGDVSRSAGSLPVAFEVGAEDLQLEEELAGPTEPELVVYRIAANKAVDVDGDGPIAASERRRVLDEPAYANVAELGLGVLGDLGIEAIGEVLLDEKLGLHIAFGRSDHFGGAVGPSDFSSPGAVVHIDRVFLPDGAVLPRTVELENEQGQRIVLMRDGRYVLDFARSAEAIWQDAIRQPETGP